MHLDLFVVLYLQLMYDVTLQEKQFDSEKMCGFCALLSHSGAPLAVGAVVKTHSELGSFDVSVDLPLPVMDQRGRADDQSAL